MNTYDSLAESLSLYARNEIASERKEILQPLIDYLVSKLQADQTPSLNFICTHNSRRSQLSQVWAYAAAHWHGVKANLYSGGVEVTAFNRSASKALEKAGFEVQVNDEGKTNPTYFIKLNETETPLATFSKLFDQETNPQDNFAAVMPCSDADDNCPYIPGTDQRISLLYEDPKLFDGTPEQEAKYLERSQQIASEMLYTFNEVKTTLS